MCVPGPDELVGIHITTCVGYPGRMVTALVCEWMALVVRVEFRGEIGEGRQRRSGPGGFLCYLSKCDFLVGTNGTDQTSAVWCFVS